MSKLAFLFVPISLCLVGCGDWITLGHMTNQTGQMVPSESATSTTPAEGKPPTNAPPGGESPTSKGSPTAPPMSGPTANMSPARIPLAGVPPASSAPVIAPTAVPTPPQGAGASIRPVFSGVAITYSTPARTKVAGDARFNQDALLAEIAGALRSRHLLDETNPHANGVVEVVINDFGVKPTSNATILGYNLGTGMLSADIRVLDAGGHLMRSFPVEASSRFATQAASEDVNPLKPLFHRFARLTVDRMQGIATTEEDPNGQAPR